MGRPRMGRPITALHVSEVGGTLGVRFGAINKKNLGEKDV